MRPYDAGMSRPAPAPDAGAGLELAPFAAAHFAPERADLGLLLCPPYDVVEPAEDEVLRRRSAHNVVHIVRPRADGSAVDGDPTPAGAGAYERAAGLLRLWRRDGTLRRDSCPALYVYEQVAAGRTQRGILGAVRITPDSARVVLPHENVFPGPVADRLALMEATEAQLEPILLVSTAATDLSALLARTTDRPAWLDATAPDGSRHRVWRLGRPSHIGAVRTALSGTQALIADGHHRYATYQLLQQARRAKDEGPGPWDHGLALLVGAADDGLTLSAVHRTVRGASVRTVSDATIAGMEALPLPGVDASDANALVREANAAADAPSGAPASIAVVVSDGARATLVRLQPGTLDLRAAAAAAVTAERLLPEVFGVTDDDARVAYHHEAQAAVSDAICRHGIALILPAPRLADVVALAGAGERMPRKSTSFSPKPRSGLVMRFLD